MKPDEPRPLWLEAIPDREPWWRGRDAAVFLSLVIVLGAIGLITWSILLGDLTIFLFTAGLGLVALLLLYLIWIGQNWPRWIVAPSFAGGGFAGAIRGIIYGSGPLFLAGFLGLTIFCYLALAPAVYLLRGINGSTFGSSKRRWWVEFSCSWPRASGAPASGDYL